MKQKGETLGERIRRIRGGRHQEKFGKELGVSQGAVSAWERDDKDRPPSADMFFRLAALAPLPEDHEFFLQKAGLSRQMIFSISQRILGERTMPPMEGEVIRVPQIRHIPKRDEEESPLLALPSLAVQNPASTGYFVIDGVGRMGGIQEGDIVILDTSEDIATSLETLWNKPVLSSLSRPAERPARDWDAVLARDEGFHLGILRCKADIDFRGGQGSLKNWIVVIDPLHEEAPIYRPDGPDYCIGEMQITQKDWKRIGAPGSLGELPAKKLEVGRMRFKLFDGIEILGHAVGWFRPPKVKAKE